MTDRFKWFNPSITFAHLEEVLQDLLRNVGLSPAERANAAALYLQGNGRYWPKNSDREAEARALMAQHGKDAPMPAIEPIEKKSKTGRSPKDSTDIEKLSAITRASAALALAMRNPDPEIKLKAIRHWYAAMEYWAPEELQKPLDPALQAAAWALIESESKPS